MKTKGRPAAPSRRVYISFAIAGVFGLAVFLIWWLTSARLRQADEKRAAEAAAATPADAPLIELALPRGGTLNGIADLDLPEASLTQAPLVRVNLSTNRIEPWLAESWTESEDHLTFLLKLRPNLVWSDGTAVAIEDVVASVGVVTLMGQPLAVRAVDAQTVEVKFPEPFAPGLRVLARLPVLPQHTSAATAGLGPFLFPPRQSPGRFTRNPHYWRKAADGSALPYLDELIVTPGAVAAGGADFYDDALPADLVEAARKLEQDGTSRVFDLGPGLDADGLWFSAFAAVPARRGSSGAAMQDRPWLTSEALRLAISMAVDRREYCKQVFFGACEPLAGPVTSANAEWFNPDLPVGIANPDLAKAMLADLGLRDRNGDGLLDDAALQTAGFTLAIDQDVAASVRAATFIRDTLRAVGVDVTISAVGRATLRDMRATGDYEAIYDRIHVRDTDPALNLDFWLSSGSAHVWAAGGVREPFEWEREIDQLMLKNVSTFDRAERLQAFVDAQKIHHQHMPVVFFGVPYVRILTSTRLLNATPSPLRPHLLWNADSLAALSPSAPKPLPGNEKTAP